MSLLRLKARGQRLFACLALVTALATPACQKPDASNLPGVEGPEPVQPTPHQPEQPPVVPERMEPINPPVMPPQVDPKVPPVKPPPDRPDPPPDPEPMAALPKFISAGSSQNGSSDDGFGNPSADAGTGGTAGTAGGNSSGGMGGTGAGDNNSGGDGDASGENGGGATDERTPEEGDIFRVLDDQRIVNLNAYRGLQVIDISNPSAPVVEGRLPLEGYGAVELYVVGDRVLVLMNDYQGSEDGEYRGAVLAVDISDRSNPVLEGSVALPGYVRTSRLVSDSQRAAVYVATQVYGYYEDSQVVVTSIDAASLEVVDEVPLTGNITDIQATDEALLVASYSYTDDYSSLTSTVSVIDISSPDGAMTIGDAVNVPGYVRSQFNMDLYNGVLRVVSNDSWSSGQNILRTFDAADLNSLTPLSSCEFGAGEDLYATLFSGNRGFFVTYLRVDPFHAFSIGDDGACEERSQFEVSGWNDFFRTVQGGDRLIGVGQNDESGSRSAVSLYDISDLDNASPLLARAEVEADGSWSSAQWEHRAFTVLEDAVSVAAPSGAIETGLVLLPFSGWEESDGYFAGVQIFTFSESTLTRRGAMDHGSHVERSFVAADDTSGNLSQSALSLYDHSNPNAPAELGRVDLAPNHSQVFVFGDHLARLRLPTTEYYYYGSTADPARIEIVPAGSEPEAQPPIASFEVPANARLYQAGDTLVAVTTQVTYGGGGNGDDAGVSEANEPAETTYATTVLVFDLQDPTEPTLASTLTTDQPLGNSYYGYYGDYYYGGCYGYGCGGSSNVAVTDAGIVFARSISHEEVIGTEEICEEGVCGCMEVIRDGDLVVRCFSGGESCVSIDDGAPTCSGELQECDELGANCGEVQGFVPTTRSCRAGYRRDYWVSFELDVLSLSNPSAATLITMALPESDHSRAIFASGDSIYYTRTETVNVPGDARPHEAHYFQRLAIDAGGLRLSPAVNVPGQLIAVADGSHYTRDTLYADDGSQSTTLNRLTVNGTNATLHATLSFEHGAQAVDHDEADRLFYVQDAYYEYPDDGMQPLPNLCFGGGQGGTGGTSGTGMGGFSGFGGDGDGDGDWDDAGVEPGDMGDTVDGGGVAGAAGMSAGGAGGEAGGIAVDGGVDVNDGADASVSEDPYYPDYEWGYIYHPAQLVILDASTLEVLATQEIVDGGYMISASEGRALFYGGGVGAQLYDETGVTESYPLRGWGNSLVWEGNDLYYPGGPYGISHFDTTP